MCPESPRKRAACLLTPLSPSFGLKYHVDVSLVKSSGLTRKLEVFQVDDNRRAGYAELFGQGVFAARVRGLPLRIR